MGVTNAQGSSLLAVPLGTSDVVIGGDPKGSYTWQSEGQTIIVTHVVPYVTVRGGSTTVVDSTSNVTDVVLESGGSVVVGDNTTVTITLGNSTTGSTITVGSGSVVTIQGGTNVTRANITVADGGTLIIVGGLDSPSSSLTVDEGSTIQVNNGTLNVGNVVLILRDPPKPCESRVINVATADGASTLPSVSFGSQLGPGVSGTPSFTGNTLSVVVAGNPEEGSECFASVDGRGSLFERHAWLAPLLAFLAVAVATVCFVLLIRKMHSHELKRRHQRDAAEQRKGQQKYADMDIEKIQAELQKQSAALLKLREESATLLATEPRIHSPFLRVAPKEEVPAKDPAPPDDVYDVTEEDVAFLTEGEQHPDTGLSAATAGSASVGTATEDTSTDFNSDANV